MNAPYEMVYFIPAILRGLRSCDFFLVLLQDLPFVSDTCQEHENITENDMLFVATFARDKGKMFLKGKNI